jgi:hypothetical protein
VAIRLVILAETLVRHSSVRQVVVLINRLFLAVRAAFSMMFQFLNSKFTSSNIPVFLFDILIFYLFLS